MHPSIDEKQLNKRIDEILSQMTLREKVALLAGRDTWNTVPIPRLGIPSVVMTDGPHGVRANNAECDRPGGPTTCFPTGISMGASWNPELVQRVAAALAEETRAMGCDILLGPCVNIVRHPLGGRNFETYSEDPFLSGRIAVGWIDGLQSQNIGASLKHFAANNQEIERGRSSSEVDERTLREIYLPAFETAVKEAQPWTVMCSYNRINGVYASQNHYLLTEILRDEWGFKGLVVSDWGANHTIFESVEAGLDLEMPGPAKYYGNLLSEAVYNWQVDAQVIDTAARRVLRLILLTCKMDGGTNLPAERVNTPEHQALARELAEEAATLLKNDHAALPLDLSKIKTVAVIGPNAAECRIGGGGSSYVIPPYRVSPLEALKERLEPQVKVEFEQGCDNYVEPPLVNKDWLAQPDGGFQAEYYNNGKLSGLPAATRVDTTPDYWWFGTRPCEGITEMQYSARWTAHLNLPRSGLYTFRVDHSGECHLYLDGELLVDHTAPDRESFDLCLARHIFQKKLEAGHTYDLRLEFAKLPGQNFGRMRIGLAYTPEPDKDDRFTRAVELARRCDIALIFAGMPEGYETEGMDRLNIDLPGRQNELIEAVSAANPDTVVVLNVGAPVAMPWIDKVPAVLEAYYPGLEGGHAAAKVLLGEVNPSGKLPVTFPRCLEDNPGYINNTYRDARKIVYGEGIFVGYRYYDARKVEPLFPFGHGLSYTTFNYSALKAPSSVNPGDTFQVSVKITNTGKVAGKEVVQLYVSDAQAALPRPPKELKGFAKVQLQPGESQVVKFTLNPRSLAFYDPAQKSWVAEPGDYTLLVGSSSRDIRAQKTIQLTGLWKS